jgi:hypothetical protein
LRGELLVARACATKSKQAFVPVTPELSILDQLAEVDLDAFDPFRGKEVASGSVPPELRDHFLAAGEYPLGEEHRGSRMLGASHKADAF